MVAAKPGLWVDLRASIERRVSCHDVQTPATRVRGGVPEPPSQPDAQLTKLIADKLTDLVSTRRVQEVNVSVTNEQQLRVGVPSCDTGYDVEKGHPPL